MNGMEVIMGDEERNLARSARTVQNLQLMLLVGMIVGGIVGVLLAAYVILPAFNDSGAGFFVAIAAIPVCAFVGQRVVLAIVAR